jgi:hypothetical protein
MIRVFLIFFIASFAVGCNQITSNENMGRPIARVHDRILYEKDLIGIVGENNSHNDSIVVINNYVNTWVRQTLMLYQAENNLPAENTAIERQLENYRRSLLIFAYEQEFVAQKLDTTVADSTILNFYIVNQEGFKLKNDIAKVSYFRISKNTPKIDSAKIWFKSNDAIDLIRLDNYCLKYSSHFALEDTSWRSPHEVMRSMSTTLGLLPESLRKNYFYEFEDGDFLIFLQLFDLKTKGDYSPLSFERNNIRQMILNKRKLTLLKSLESDLYNQALKKGNFEIFVN